MANGKYAQYVPSAISLYRGHIYSLLIKNLIFDHKADICGTSQKVRDLGLYATVLSRGLLFCDAPHLQPSNQKLGRSGFGEDGDFSEFRDYGYYGYYGYYGDYGDYGDY